MLDLSHQETRPQSVPFMFDRGLQAAQGAFHTFGLRAQQAEVVIDGRVGESGCHGFFQFLGSLGFLFFGLGVDGLTDV